MRLDRVVAAVGGLAALGILGGIYFAARRSSSAADDDGGDDLTPLNVVRAVEHAVTGGLVFHMERAPSQSQMCRDFLNDWNVKGPFPITIIFGDRTNAQQSQLYEQGRTTPGDIVTDAPDADSSSHGHGAGWDSAAVREVFANGLPKRIFTGKEPDSDLLPDGTKARDRANSLRDQYIARVKAAGLRSGADFPNLYDPWHAEDPAWESYPVVETGVTSTPLVADNAAPTEEES